MTGAGKKILEEALALPANERAELVAELLTSLDETVHDDPSDIELAWVREAEKRLEEIRAGTRATMPWEEARKLVFDRS